MDWSTLLLGLLAGVIGIYYLLYRKMDCFKGTGIPHIAPVPFVGNLGPSMLGRVPITDVVQKIYNLNREAKYVGMYSLTTPVVMVRDPELIKLIGVKNFESLPNHHTFGNMEQDPLASKNLLVLHGQRWRDVRTLLSPSFTSAKIKTMFKLITQCAMAFTDFMSQLPEEKREMDMKDAFTRYTNDVIASCAFGIKVDSMRDPKNEFYIYGKETSTFTFVGAVKLFLLTNFPRISKWLKLRMNRKQIADFFQNIIEKIIETRDKTGTSRPDMVQLMMDARGKDDGRNLSLEDMTSQAFIFFLAGFETTSALMCFAAHEIAVNPDVHDRLQDEIDEVLRSTNGEVIYEAVNGMKYLDAVINEALRMYPIAFVMDRVCERSIVLPPTLPGTRSFTLKEGTDVWFPAYGLHHDPKYFEEPERFRPERFLEDGTKILNSGAYFPFGVGPRMCIANRFALLETKVLFFCLLARCDLKPCPKTKVPLKMSKTRAMFPEAGFWLNLQPRSNYPNPTIRT